MNKKYIKIIVAILSLTVLFNVSSFAQSQKRVIVKDESGNPVTGASITIGEAAKPVQTNEKGEFVMKIEKPTPLLLEAEGYESQIITASPLIDLVSVVLVKTPYQMGVKDKINVPFWSFRKRQIPGAVSAIIPADLLKYDQPKNFGDALYGRIPGFFGSSDNRGLGSPLVVVDGIPRTSVDYNLQEIGQITVLKDVFSSMLYGGQANNGVIYITTKRGEPLKKNMNFTYERGINKPISYPSFLSSGEYMPLYNEALANDGLAPKYTQTTIDNTISGSMPVQFPNEDYYNSTYLKKFSSYSNFVGEVSGGNEIAQYYLNLGWNSKSGFINLGEDGNEIKDRFNVRGNVDYKLNDIIKIRFDGSVVFNISSTPRFTSPTNDFWTLSSTLHPDYTPVLIPVDPVKDKTLIGAAKLIDNKYLLGGTSQYMTNIYGELTRNGPTEINERLVEMNVGLDFDLKFITKGLTGSVLFSYDLQNVFRTDIMNTYAVYKPNYTGNAVTSFSKYNVDVKVNDQTLSDVSFYRKTGLYGKIDYHRIFGDHDLTVNALSYQDQYSVEGIMQPTKHLNFGTRVNYNYRKKFIAELSALEVGSVKLSETKKWAFSPGIGLAWVLTEENFMKGKSFVNYLKVKSNWAITNTDEGLLNYYPGRDMYTLGSTYTYNHGLGANAARLLAIGNTNLGFEKRMNFNLGFDASLFNNKLGVEGSYFYYKTYDLITKRVNYLPGYFASLGLENYGSYQSKGVEFGLNYTEHIGDLEVRFGSNFSYSLPKALVVDELNYPDEYRKAQGKPTDAMFGFVAIGLFKDLADINNSTIQTFGTVKPGDIKYQDLNNDKVIDDLDQKMIGNSHSRLQYSFNMNLKYKEFELFLLGTGQNGMSNYANNSYYWVYGDRKYSDVVLNRWTPATAQTATYPRLTTLPSSNNFRNSTYWLYNTDWFTLNTAQLTYSLVGKIAGIKEARFFVRSNNLFTVAKNREKMQLNIGTAPQTRFLSLGITVML